MNTKLVMNQSNLQVRPTLPKNKHKDKFSQILTTSNFVAKNFLIVLCWQKHLLIVFNCYISNNVIDIYISYHIYIFYICVLSILSNAPMYSLEVVI